MKPQPRPAADGTLTPTWKALSWTIALLTTVVLLGRLAGLSTTATAYLVGATFAAYTFFLWWNAQAMQRLHWEVQGLSQLSLHGIILNNMAEGVCLVRQSDATIVYANPRFEAIFGYLSGELQNKPVAILNYRGSEAAKEIIDSVVAQGAHTYEVRNVKKDGTPFWCRATCSIFEHPVHGRVLVAVQEDIDQKKRAEDALTASEHKFRALVETAYDTILSANEAGIITLANPRVETMFGYTPAELVGRPVEVLIPERIRAHHVSWREAYMRHPVPRPMGARVSLVGLHRDGHEIPLDIGLSPDKSHGEVTVTIRDMTERRRWEDQQVFLATFARAAETHLEAGPRIRSMVDSLAQGVADVAIIGILRGGQWAHLACSSRTPDRAKALTDALYTLTCRGRLAGSCPAALHSRPIIVRDTARSFARPHSALAALAEAIRADGISGFAVIPFFQIDGALGFMALGRTRPSRWPLPSEVIFIQELGRRVAVSLENSLLYERSRLATAARERILSIVSHDLRNPVTTIELASTVLASPTLSQERRLANLKRLKSSAGQMARLINDLLDFGKIEAGRFSVEPSPTSPREILDAAMEGLAPRAKEKDVRLLLNTPADLPAVLGDKNRLVQVLWNLVGNAIKFTPAGGTVVIRTVTAPGEVHFSVEDGGPGIPADIRPRIFEAFWQAKQTASLGTGLGLSIAKGIVDAHAGRIWATNGLEGGAVLHFTVPLVATGRDETWEEPTSPLPSLVGLRLLVVDDAPENGQMLEACLSGMGAEVAYAGSADHALNLVRTWEPDLIITDLEMPGKDGFYFLRQLREQGLADPKVPVIASSGLTDPQDISRIKVAGFDAFLPKPFSTELLIQKLGPLLAPFHPATSAHPTEPVQYWA